MDWWAIQPLSSDIWWLFVRSFRESRGLGTRTIFPRWLASESVGESARSLIPKCSYHVGFPRLRPLSTSDSRRVRTLTRGGPVGSHRRNLALVPQCVLRWPKSADREPRTPIYRLVIARSRFSSGRAVRFSGGSRSKRSWRSMARAARNLRRRLGAYFLGLFL